MCNRKHRGVALLTAMWILVVLLILVGGFAAMTHSEMQVTRNFGELTQARWAARAGIRRAETEVLTNIATQPYTALTDEQKLMSPADDDTSLGDTTYQVALQDEAGKININTASAELLGAFFPAEVVDCILDWREAGSTPRAQGAKEDYYSALTQPYHCKNAPFETVEELLLVKGVTRDMLNAKVTDDGQTLEDQLTTSSVDNNTDVQGQARLNIKTATSDTLTTRCGDVLSAAEINAIIGQGSSSFTSPADLVTVPSLAKEKIAQIYDRLTATDDKTRPGLINLNTAPVEVLVALPDMDDAAAQAIVDYRTSEGPFTDVGQLLLVDGISPEVFRSIADLCTVRSQLFRVVATGQCRDGITQITSCLLHVEQSEGSMITRTLYWHE